MPLNLQRGFGPSRRSDLGDLVVDDFGETSQHVLEVGIGVNANAASLAFLLGRLLLAVFGRLRRGRAFAQGFLFFLPLFSDGVAHGFKALFEAGLVLLGETFAYFLPMRRRAASASASVFCQA